MEEVFAVADSVDTKEVEFFSHCEGSEEFVTEQDSKLSNKTYVPSEQFSVEIKGQHFSPFFLSLYKYICYIYDVYIFIRCQFLLVKFIMSIHSNLLICQFACLSKGVNQVLHITSQ